MRRWFTSAFAGGVPAAYVLYFLSPNAKVAEVGRILLFAGALAALMQGNHSCTLK